mmetsp:Transcript_10689/g.26996  ORF Transcript_10689/g.26996 Transcript_10689/m.26996 type:complete len:88 (+) Transcript_10689:967-1230(+)
MSRRDPSGDDEDDDGMLTTLARFPPTRLRALPSRLHAGDADDADDGDDGDDDDGPKLPTSLATGTTGLVLACALPPREARALLGALR